MQSYRFDLLTRIALVLLVLRLKLLGRHQRLVARLTQPTTQQQHGEQRVNTAAEAARPSPASCRASHSAYKLRQHGEQWVNKHILILRL